MAGARRVGRGVFFLLSFIFFACRLIFPRAGEDGCTERGPSCCGCECNWEG